VKSERKKAEKRVFGLKTGIVSLHRGVAIGQKGRQKDFTTKIKKEKLMVLEV
jgi:hypothetical protein